jgi:hypothetical protein
VRDAWERAKRFANENRKLTAVLVALAFGFILGVLA